MIDRLPLIGSETVVDAGCGSGRLTAEFLESLPTGDVIAIDSSPNMLAAAESNLRPRFGDRVRFLQADVANLVLASPVDAIFSTATFHWILDHPRLFNRLFACLRPGGRLVAQCGGGPNVERLRSRAESLLGFRSYYALRPKVGEIRGISRRQKDVTTTSGRRLRRHQRLAATGPDVVCR